MSGKHPRLRGEYYRYFPGTVTGKETPPLARGILNPEELGPRHVRNTPACAGNTGRSTASHTDHWKHPRLRGEYYSVPGLVDHF